MKSAMSNLGLFVPALDARCGAVVGHAQALGGPFQTSGPVLVVGPSEQRKSVAVCV